MTAPSIHVANAGKRYTKYDDTPMLVTRIARWRTSTTRSHLWAMRSASFDVEPGDTLGIIGRNGSGKSTLLRMLSGITAPTEGLVAVRGRIAPLISVGVGFHLELTGRENVYINGTVLGMTRREIDERFDEIVDFAEIGGFIDTPVKFYSSGMFVRLGFAVSVLADPDVLIVDEVLAVGDLAFQMKCMDRMQQIRERGATIVLVSHNLNAVRILCPRTIVAHDGVLRFDGPTDEAISLYHDLLGEDREVEDAATSPSFDREFAERVVVERFDLLGPDGASTRHIQSGQSVTFEVDLSFTGEVVDPVIGFSVLNAAGVQVYGDTTPWRAGVVYRAGEKVTARIHLQPALVTGSYTCNVGISSLEGTQLARIRKPLLVYVAGRHGVNGVADLAATFEILPETSDVGDRAL